MNGKFTSDGLQSSSDASGKLIARGGLSATRTLVGSDTETVTATLELDY